MKNQPRDVVPFDYGWRFRLNTSAEPRKNCPHFVSKPEVTCSGLTFSPQGNASAELCLQACCIEASCDFWQYAAGRAQACWIGQCKDTPHGGCIGWVGGSAPAPSPGPTCPECAKDFDDSDWELVDAPHDYVIATPIDEVNEAEGGFFSRPNAVYRKHFVLPARWQGSRIVLRFEGVYKVATVYVNGVEVTVSGGTPTIGGVSSPSYAAFDVRLDNVTTVTYGPGLPNVVAISVDGTRGSEHWYTGAGIYRSVHLIRTETLHLDSESLFFPSKITSEMVRGEGVIVASAEIAPSATVVNAGVADVVVTASVRVFEFESGILVGDALRNVTITAHAKASVLFNPILIQATALWSVQTPTLYRIETSIAVVQDGTMIVIDAINTTTGIRSVEWDPQAGFWLNGLNVKWRGFCHHDDFTGVGMAMPDRLWLLRVMQTRGLGGNALRTSHNNYRNNVYAIADAVGILVLDENRDLRDSDGSLGAMDTMVRTHRNHPSVMAYSLCNEGECSFGPNKSGTGSAGDRFSHNRTIYGLFRNTTKLLDPTRSVTANMWAEWGPGSLTDFLDVQGISHPAPQWISAIRQLTDVKPLLVSECCSCQSQRGVNQGNVPSNGPQPNVTDKHYAAFNADCLQQYVNFTDSLPYVAGSMIWTLEDYAGEPQPIGWPQVSSSFGAIDFAGFPKAAARWFQAWWLNSPSPLWNNSRPPLPTSHTVYIVENNEKPHASGGNVTFHVYTSAHSVELILNGQSRGQQANSEWMGWLEWTWPYTQGNVTAVARDANGATVNRHTVVTTVSEASALALTVDVPSPTTATGERVLLDGHDVILVRATVIDEAGNLAPSSSTNVTFEVVSGPGRVLGVGNGDPFCKEPHQVPWRSTYNGLARGIIKVTVDAATDPGVRALIREIDVDTATVEVMDPTQPFTPTPIVVRAVGSGLSGDATIVVDVSTDTSRDGVLATSRSSTHLPISLE